MHRYGHFKYLTYHCLLIQFISAILHIAANFSRPLQKVRDIWFLGLAYPVGSIVVYTFWAVWHIMGRELIFPIAITQYHPDWLNHVTHTLIAPLNLIMLVLINHKGGRVVNYVNLLYMALYTSFLYLFKSQTGNFIYKYLETMGDVERLLYFAGTGVFSQLMCKTGDLLTNLVHGRATQRPVIKKQKQK